MNHSSREKKNKRNMHMYYVEIYVVTMAYVNNAGYLQDKVLQEEMFHYRNAKGSCSKASANFMVQP